MGRSYDNARRSAAAAETAGRIAEVAERLLAEGPFDGVTLQAIADGAGVSVQTVLRHMGSRDGCIEAVRQRVGARIAAQRGETTDPIGQLLAHYEAEGRLILNLLAQEGAVAFARQAVEEGRAFHRAWVVRCFGVDDDALVAATDLYVWKLLRLDLGRSAEATREVVERLVRAALESR